MFLVDSHCHFDLIDHTDADTLIARANAQGVQYFLNVCVTLRDFAKVLAVAKAHANVSASVGLHPNEEEEGVANGDTLEETLVRLGQHPKVVAIGETGLDFFRSTGDLAWQHARFRSHIAAAKTLQKPLIIHTRAAKEATLTLMRESQAHHIGGVMHCFTEDWETAKAALDLNFYISFSGIVTFKNAKVIQEVAKRMPLDRLLLETDAPYLAPEPMRGKPNEPAFMRHTAAYIAALRGIDVERLAEQSTKNFFTLFKGAAPSHV